MSCLLSLSHRIWTPTPLGAFSQGLHIRKDFADHTMGVTSGYLQRRWLVVSSLRRNYRVLTPFPRLVLLKVFLRLNILETTEKDG